MSRRWTTLGLVVLGLSLNPGWVWANAPYDLWTEPCLQKHADAEAVRLQLAEALEHPDDADFPALVCAALGIFDNRRWQQNWGEWEEGSDELGCSPAERDRQWRVELFLSPHAHHLASSCRQAEGDSAAAAAAAKVGDGVMEAFLTRTNGSTFDQGIPLMMPVDLMVYTQLFDREVIAFWAKPYHRGTRMVFKLATAAKDGQPQRIYYFEWALPVWLARLGSPGSAEGGPWMPKHAGDQFAKEAADSPLGGAARTYAAFSDFAGSRKNQELLQRIRVQLQPAIEKGDSASMFEMAQYELELPGGDRKLAIDLLLALADSGEARATAMLAAPTLMGWGDLDGGAEAAQALVAKAAQSLAPGDAEFYAAAQLGWSSDKLADEWLGRWLLVAAELHHPEAMQSYAEYLDSHDRNPEARIWMERAAEVHVSAIGMLVGAIGKDDPAALPWLERAAHWDPGAMRMLAERTQSEDWWLRAAVAGDLVAALRQARRQLAQDSIEADSEALRWALWGVQRGRPDALSLMIAADLRGRSDFADPSRGQNLLKVLKNARFEITAESAPELLYEMARREETGDLLTVNRRHALKSYKQLAAREHAPALVRLAELELADKPSKARSERAATLLKRAHAAGSRAAPARLAALYRDPQRRITDEVEAVRWDAEVVPAE